MISPRRPGSPALGHILIEDVRPSVELGRWPVKRIAGRPCAVEATIVRDGPAQLRAVLLWRREEEDDWSESPLACVEPGLDRWRGQFTPARPGMHVFTLRAWTDAYASWLDDLRRRVQAGLDIRGEALEGAALLESLGLDEAAARVRGAAERPADVLSLAADPALRRDVERRQPRRDEAAHPELRVYADRPRALFGSWYEMFPRSQGTSPGVPSTLREAERRFPDLRGMGFDVLYLPPIHPIGRTKRKGKNNSLTAGPGDPGSPWAIGSEAGGHDAVAPELGTLADFDHFVAEAARHGLEIALDMALQCSPDHPWVKAHPEWFYQRPDGTLKFAENPPKKYEDIYPLNFDSEDREGLYREIRRVFQVWIDRGVRIFRVDNPHTKPPGFWEGMIADIQKKHPDVLFLAEAFTRPPMMKALAKLGFTQSYTYFTWRDTKADLIAYMKELVESADYFRPNFFVNTPDILPRGLVEGGRPAFRQRLVLAATLSPSYGIYSGYELCENAAIPHHAYPDDVEYADSEKYEIRVRDWNAPGNIKDLVTRLNRARRENAALRELAPTVFLNTTDERLLAYLRRTEDFSNALIVVVNLDPRATLEGTVDTPHAELGLPPGARFIVRDLVSGARYPWGGRDYVRLDPSVEPAHVFVVERSA